MGGLSIEDLNLGRSGKKDYSRFRPGECGGAGAAALYFRAFYVEGPRGGIVSFCEHREHSVVSAKDAPVGFEPRAIRSEVRTSSAAANPPTEIPRQSVPLKGRLFALPLVLLRLLVCRWFRYPFPRSGSASRWFRFSSPVGLSVVS